MLHKVREEEIEVDAGTVNGQSLDLFLNIADLFNRLTERSAEAIDSLSRESDLREFLADLFLLLNKSRRAGTVTLINRLDLFKLLADAVKNLQNAFLQFFKLPRRHTGSADISEVALLLVLRIVDAVNDFINRERAFANTLGICENLADGRRARGNSGHHMPETVFNPAGNSDFTFTREQFDRTHFAHVHADRIRRAAEFSVH